MKLLMTTDTIGGVWTYALQLAEALGPHGVNVALATMGNPVSPEQWHDVRQIANLEVFESRYQLEWMQDPWADVQAAGRWLLDLEQQEKPDIVHLNGYTHGVLPWRAPALIVAHSCVLSWWHAVKHEPAPPQWDRYRHFVTAGLRGAKLVVAPSQVMLDAVRRHYGEPKAARVIYNAREAGYFPPRPKEQFILAAGRLWDEAKNIAALERIADHVAWPICLAGEQRHPDGRCVAGAQSVLRLGCLGRREMAGWFGRASIYALPARYEPFGLSALEAALAGCALVLGDIPSLREIWGDTALFVAPEDSQALADALNHLVADDAHRVALATLARRRALQLTPARQAAEYLAAYNALLAAQSLARQTGERAGQGKIDQEGWRIEHGDQAHPPSALLDLPSSVSSPW